MHILIGGGAGETEQMRSTGPGSVRGCHEGEEASDGAGARLGGAGGLGRSGEADGHEDKAAEEGQARVDEENEVGLADAARARGLSLCQRPGEREVAGGRERGRTHSDSHEKTTPKREPVRM